MGAVYVCQLIKNIVNAVDSRSGSLISLGTCFLMFAFAVAIDNWGGALTKLFLPGSVIYRFNAGFILAIYAMGGRSVATFVWLSLRDGAKFFEPTLSRSDRWYRYVLVIGMFGICVIGIVAWLVGWNGSRTGTAYGVGAFVGVTMYGWSIGGYVGGTSPRCSRCQTCDDSDNTVRAYRKF